MKKLSSVLIVILLLSLTTPAFAMPATVASTQADPVTSGHYIVQLRPLNNSGVRGIAEIWVQGDNLKVMIHANGLTPNEVHLQHIHMGNTCDPLTPVLMPLTPYPTSSHSGIGNFMHTYQDAASNLAPLETRTVVLHGMMVDGTYSAGTPVACGVVRAVPGLH